MSGSGRIRYTTALRGLSKTASGDVGLILTDPPQGITRATFDIAPDWSKLWPEIWRVLADDGAVLVMAGSLKAAMRIIETADHFRYDLVWAKNKASGFYNAKKAPLRAHEYVLVFYRKPGSYTAHRLDGHRPMEPATRAAKSGHGNNYDSGRRDTKSEAGTTLRYATSTLRFPVVNNNTSGRIHHQQKPVSLGRRLVQLYSRPGDTVLDMFSGSGSFVVSAMLEGRHGIGFEINKDHVDKARIRLKRERVVVRAKEKRL